MKPQNQPTEIAGFAEFGTGRTNWSHSCNMESNRRDVSPAIELELELGTGYSKRSCGFTIFQLQELQLQSLIYKYMEAGLAVPRQLVIPIWKSVSSSVAGFNSGLQQLYPSFFGSGSVHLELRNGIDPEPGRCRRTDGKKWRCSKEAIPDHKYCERHVHRGRLRSRKLVEASRPNYSITSSTTNTNANANTNLSISPPTVSNPSPNFGFSPRSVLHGGNKKT